MGRKTIKTSALLDAICEGIAQGKSARAMCIETGISQQTLWNWLAADKSFFEQYARAKELCADFIAEEILEIADDKSGDKKFDDNGREITDHEFINRSRLRVDARKWYASKLSPKKYGDKIVNEHQGNPDQPILTKVEVILVSPSK